jgi:hypothetical protein
MRYAWTDWGDDPSYNAAFNGYFFPAFDPLTSRALIQTVPSMNVKGIYTVSTSDPSSPWFPKMSRSLSPGTVVDNVQSVYNGLAIPGLRVQFDMEEKDPDRILAILTAWRIANPTVGTSWTMEAGQAGWMNDPTFRDAIIALKMRIVPQCYNGAMTQVWDTWAYLKPLVDGGYPTSILSPFYDAKHLPVGWDGFAFTVGRLP